jgi:hypothetical protein
MRENQPIFTADGLGDTSEEALVANGFSEKERVYLRGLKEEAKKDPELLDIIASALAKITESDRAGPGGQQWLTREELELEAAKLFGNFSA